MYHPSQVPVARFINSLRETGVPIAEIRSFLKLDAGKREALLARWQDEVASRLLSIRIASQYLHGLKPDKPQIHLERWEERSQLVWSPVSGPPGPLPFAGQVAARKRELERRHGFKVITSGYARTLDFRDGRLEGELGFRVKPRRPIPAGLRVEEIPPTLFATLECTLNDDKASHRVFRFLDQFGFRPSGLHLERSLPGISDRYLLMLSVEPMG